MTDGSSQGLFVIVAVVIFGIFVIISYLLFRDKLQTGLASIFTDSINLAKDDSVEFIDGTSLVSGKYVSSVSQNLKEFTITKETASPDASWGVETPIGLTFNKNVEIPYGYKIVVKMEIFVEKETIFYYDMNANNKDNTTAFLGNNSLSYADAYGDYYKGNIGEKIKANTWTNAEYGFTNNSINNINKIAIHDFTTFGFRYSDLDDVNTFKIRNIEYKIVKI